MPERGLARSWARGSAHLAHDSGHTGRCRPLTRCEGGHAGTCGDGYRQRVPRARAETGCTSLCCDSFCTKEALTVSTPPGRAAVAVICTEPPWRLPVAGPL